MADEKRLTPLEVVHYFCPGCGREMPPAWKGDTSTPCFGGNHSNAAPYPKYEAGENCDHLPRKWKRLVYRREQEE